MGKKEFFTPDGYIASRAETVLGTACILLVVILLLVPYLYYVTIPSAPPNRVLESAYMHIDVTPTNGKTDIYIKTKKTERTYTVSLWPYQISNLNLYKGKNLLISTGPSEKKEKRFLWEVYDGEEKVIFSQKDIVNSVEENNSSMIILAVLVSLFSSIIVYWMSRYAVYNRFFNKKRHK